MKNLRTLPLLWLCLAVLLPAGGCSCWKDPLAGVTENEKPTTLEEMEAQRRKLQEKQEEKPDFETVRLTVLPADDAPTRNQVKPGHWFNAVQTMKANNFDFPKGDLHAQCVDTVGNPIPLPGSEFELQSTRPVSLPEGQSKHFDLLLFANMPRRTGTINFITRLRPRGGGREVDWKHEACTRMKPFQNHLVVLAERVDNYQWVKTLRSIKPERSSDEFLAAELDYFVKLPKGTRRVDLPSHPLAWSNIAYIVWDDYEPEILNPAQQQAMLDWLHWGGQLIINGPRTLDRLGGSFLSPYLPARAGEISSLSAGEVTQLNQHWTFQGEPEARPLRIPEQEEPPLTIELNLADNAHFVERTADLVAAREVGRGRILTTAFNLPHAVFLAWDSYDTFFNSCLLGRPARLFDPKEDSIVEYWAVNVPRDDPRINSTVRYFSRDAEAVSTRSQRSLAKIETDAEQRRQNAMRQTRNSQSRRAAVVMAASESPPIASQVKPPPMFGFTGFAKDDLIGVAGWSDQSDVSQEARYSLQKSAGISVPSVDFIAKVLGIYLVVLVPLNWLIFRLMGRVEWAWAAVPIIAIGGALGVVQAAQLDIGFARSRTEIAVVEIQPNYDRAHLTRYVGLYTSLSSSYQITGEQESALFQPLASAQRADREVALYQGDQVSLSGFNVLSNSTGLIHSEEMLPLGGVVTVSHAGGKSVLNNQTDHRLRSACVVRRREDQVVEVAWVGDLDAKATVDLQLNPLESDTIDFAEWERLPATSRQSEEGDLNIRRIIDIATDPQRLGLGEMVLVGWNDQVVPGVTISPTASQTTVRTLYVAQLEHARRPTPRRDENCFAVLKRQNVEDERDTFGIEDF